MEGLFCMIPRISEAAAAGGSVGSFGFSFIGLSAGSAPPEGVDASFSFLTELPEMKTLLFRVSCNGLVLLEHREEPRSGRLGYIVCNPSTKEWEAVPNCGSPTLLTYPYLAFDPAVSSHFSLVQFQVEDDDEFLSVHACSFETGTWSRNQTDEEEDEGQLESWRQVRFILGDPNLRCPFVNGFLHLLVQDDDEVKIVALDVQGKSTRMIPVPHVADAGRFMCYFGESQGKLHYMTQEVVGDAAEGKYKLSVWVLEDYDTKEWVLKHTTNTHEVFGEDSCTDATSEFEVVDVHQDCNVAFFADSLDQKLVAYDMDNEDVSVIGTFEDQKGLIGTARNVPCF